MCSCIDINPQGEATLDSGTAVLVFLIDSGRSGEVGLDGLCFALLICSGRPMAEGNWASACVADERADAAQPCALSASVGSEAGGTPGVTRSGLISDFRGVVFKPVETCVEGLTRRAPIPDVVSFESEGVTSRNCSGEPLYLDTTAYPVNRRLALARAGRLNVQGFGLDIDMVGKGNDGCFTPFAWAG
jgi:hypothetical protein